MEKPPVGVMPKRKGKWGLVLLASIVVVVLVFIGYQTVVLTELSRQLPEGAKPISFTDTGIQETFLLSDLSLLAQPRIRAGDAVIVESQELPTAGEKAVLAIVPNTPGTVLGVMHGNGNFEPMLSDGSLKTDLRVFGSLAVYSVPSRPVLWSPTEVVPKPEEDENDTIEGSATGPVDSGVDYTLGTSQNGAAIPGGVLYSFDIAGGKSSIRIGAGKSPRVTADGGLVALSSEGIVKIDVRTGARKLLLPYIGGDGVGSSISADGTVALLHSEGNSVSDVYEISGNTTTSVGSIVSSVPTFGATFADDTHILLRTGKSSVALYLLPNDIAILNPPTAHLSIIAPQ